MNRREFLSAVPAAGVALLADGPVRGETPAANVSGARVYKHRVQFGCWINDMRNEALPRTNWPALMLDDQTEKDIIDCLKFGKESGFNEMDVWGLFESYAYPVEIGSAFAVKERRPRVDRIMSAARERGIKIIYGMGVYSWGFDEIIKRDPKVQGNNPHVMCASSDASMRWQAKLVDAIAGELGVDGFHLESADQGRCTCSKCARMGNVEYHGLVSSKTADYIREKYPEKLVECTIQGWSEWGKNLSEADKQRLVELSSHVDVIFDQGHRRTYIEPERRGEFIARLKCDYGTSGGFWVYPPARWQRLRWFFPYAHRTGDHIRSLFEQGGRAVMFYQGPIINPGVELSLAVGGKMMCDASRSVENLVGEVVDERYRPKNGGVRAKLCDVFLQPERAYFSQWDEARIQERHKVPAPGELHLTPLFGDSPGGPTYLCEPFLDREGRKVYRGSLLAAYDTLVSCRDACEDGGRLSRAAQCIVNAVADVETVMLGQGE